MGFVVVAADTLLFFHKFTQKPKVLYFHIFYFLLFFICAVVALADSNYLNYMSQLLAIPSNSAPCTSNGYLNECYLAPSFLSYRSNYVAFFIVFLIFFIAYASVYHYAVLKVLPLAEEQERAKNNQQSPPRKASIEHSNKKNVVVV
jgi:hypothetical protein